MSLRKNKNFGGTEGFNSSRRKKQPNPYKRVVDIILNAKHPMYKTQDDIGTIFFCDVQLKEITTKPFSLPRAKPININNYTAPLIGEIVQVTEAFTPSPELEGNPISTNYYQNCINVHNNAGSNALPLDISKKEGNDKSKTEPDTTTFEFKKEFTSPSREVADRELENYLRDLGYISGRSDPRAPKYKLFQKATGEFVFRLDEDDDDSNTTQRLGNWFKEKKNQRNLNPTEGGTIIQGKSGQRINMLVAGPNGENSVSRNVTDVEGDGNPNIGDRALILSLGEGTSENVTFDAASIYLGENLSLPIDAASTNADSTKSTFEPIKDPLEQIETPPPAPIPNSTPEPTLQIQKMEFDDPRVSQTQTSVTETTPVVASKDDFSDEMLDDPVFEALAEAQEEGNIDFASAENYEIAGTETPREEEGNEINDEDEPENPVDESGESTNRDWLLRTDGGQNYLKGKRDYRNFIQGKSMKEMEKYYPLLLKPGKGSAKNAEDILLDPKAVNDMIERLRGDGVNAENCPRIKHLIIHTTATKYRNQYELVDFFYYTKRWKRHGYNISVDSDGKCNYNVNIRTTRGSNGCALNVYPEPINFGPGVYNGVSQEAETFGRLTNKNSINISWIGTLNSTPVRTFSELNNTTKPNITAAQSHSFQKLIEYFCEAFPNIKIAGHNQVTIKKGSGKACPSWNTVRLLDLMKGEPGSNIKDKNIFRKFPNHISNDEYLMKIYLSDTVGSTQKAQFETFDNVQAKADKHPDKRVFQNFKSYMGKKYTQTADYVFALTHPSKYS